MSKLGALGDKIGALGQVMAGETIVQLPLDLIDYDPENPGGNIDPEELAEMAESIRLQGVLQPVVVVRREGGRYKMAMGEKRHRASGLAGKATIPSVIRDYDDETLEIVRLMENYHRKDVAPEREAAAIKRIIEKRHGGARGAARVVAQVLGISEATVSQRLALLELPAPIQQAVEDGVIGDATAAIQLAKVHAEDPEAAAPVMDKIKAGEKVGRNEVRQAAAEAKAKKPAKKTDKKPEEAGARCPNTPDLMTGKTDAQSSDSREESTSDLSLMWQNQKVTDPQIVEALEAHVLSHCRASISPLKSLSAVVRQIRVGALALGVDWEDILAAAAYDTTKNEKTTGGKASGGNS